ncbi:leucyl/phenylalanyl-tRNA--protein transferase [Sediminibacterium goheungense]|uniref:Leucyl/phenylalanyl-tRNA--protein transferase n=1 Tax=Sediminibacterium goheungense TaxID=1086393 RepID=A0A4R6J043_9BACT|nr:leucyl/phenylalanyl-tRNA--protein transferase [Sediminibacterium goheungense]TDO28101.1 leucyl/phenylalanyl-tRNA--protein transferase [Sediminibacterium goheungense]
MSLHALDSRIWFPPVEDALDDGLLAIGGDVAVERLLLAYRNGIFPWYDDESIPLWWSPDPRFVLYPEKLKISKSMTQVFKKGHFSFHTNTHFADVIHACKALQRKGQDGTWITDELEQSFIQLHEMGVAHSAETWLDGELVGGLYGIRMGPFFFGESMFSKQSNASKFAFISYVQQLKKEGVQLIDCQVHTDHLESLGAEMIPRQQFIQLLQQHL